MVALEMVAQRVVGDVEDGFLQFLQVVYAGHLLAGVGVFEHKVAETEQVVHVLTQFLGEGLGAFLDESHLQPFGVDAVTGFGRVDDDGQHRVEAAQVFAELETGGGILGAFALETDIGDHPQHIVLVGLVVIDGFVVAAGQQYLGTAPHAQGALVGVQGFSGEVSRLLEHEFVQVGQDGGVEADRVFDQHDHLHADRLDILADIHPVFHQFDDGQQQVGVAQPAEHVIDGRGVGMDQVLGHFTRKGSEQHDGDAGILVFDTLGNLERFHAFVARHVDN